MSGLELNKIAAAILLASLIAMVVGFVANILYKPKLEIAQRGYQVEVSESASGGHGQAPEIPVDIYELGLIYDVMINEDADVKILMTLTSPNCPVAETLPAEVEEKVRSIDAVKSCEVEITFEPTWTKDLMSEEAKLELGML